MEYIAWILEFGVTENLSIRELTLCALDQGFIRWEDLEE